MTRLLRLVRVELSRLRYRRAVLLLLAACVVLPVVIAVAIVLDTRPPSDAALADAEREAAAMADDPFAIRQVRRCTERPGRFGIPPEVRAEPDLLQDACEDSTLLDADDLVYTNELSLDQEREFGSGLAVVALLATAMFLVGTTFVGHDWNTGSMSNQLLFETRRLRVWGAKALAVLSVALALSATVLTAYWLGLNAVATGRGIDVPPGALLDCLQHGWRGAGVAGAAALGGYALTNLFRSTVFSLGVLFGVSVVGGLLLAAIGPRDPGWVDPTINALAVISDGTTYFVEPDASCYGGPGGFDDTDPACVTERDRSLAQGVAYYGIVLGAVGVASAVSFRRRDVP